jgi:protocatechuate 3,4-dioxygenase alpha subunit
MSDEPRTLVALPSQTVGPFFHFALTFNERLGCLAGPACRGERIRLEFRVLDGAGAPVPDAMIEIWQADADGRYAEPAGAAASAPSAGPASAFTYFGRLPTSAEGTCAFDTIRPGAPQDGGRLAAHVNVGLFARGLQRHLYTRVYFADDAHLDDDPFLQLVPSDRRPTILLRQDPPAGWRLDIHLQGPDETVFFDL